MPHTGSHSELCNSRHRFDLIDPPKNEERDGLATVNGLINSMPPQRDQPSKKAPIALLTHAGRLSTEQAHRGGIEQQQAEHGAREHLSTVTGRLNALDRELNSCQSSATEAKVAEVRHRPDGPVRQITFVNSMPPPRGQSHPPIFDPSLVGMRARIKAGSSKRNRLSASDQWAAGSNQGREQIGPSADHLTLSSFDLLAADQPQVHPVEQPGLIGEKSTRSRLASLAKAGLAMILAAAIAITGAYFVRANPSGPPIMTSVGTFFRTKATTTLVELLSSIKPPRRAVAQETFLPIPDLYGVYAISNGQLVELEPLPGQVPDQRISMSGAIFRPSRIVLPSGHLVFIVFRRDIAASISERVPIRVIARVRRTMMFGPAGEPRSADVGDTWTFRNISFDFRVAPMTQNREMVLLRPGNADFVLSPGRYALVLKGQAYDFTVDGPITEPAQCLERVEAANGSFYHACQQSEAEAVLPLQEDPPSSPRPRPRLRDQGNEEHASAYVKAAKLR